MTEVYEPQSDDMTGFNPQNEKVVYVSAGTADGTIISIAKRMPLNEEELKEIKIQKIKTLISEYEAKLIDGTISEFEFNKLNLLYKLI